MEGEGKGRKMDGAEKKGEKETEEKCEEGILVTARDPTVCPHVFPSLPEVPRSQAGRGEQGAGLLGPRNSATDAAVTEPSFPATVPRELS